MAARALRLVCRTSLAVVLVAMFAAAVEATVQQINLIHRHGASDQPTVATGTGETNWKASQLSASGRTMSANLGTFLKSSYGPVIPATYDPMAYVVVTSAADRCDQSAQLALANVFGVADGDGTFAPRVQHLQAEQDWLLEFNANYPSVQVRQEWYRAFEMDDAHARSVLSEGDIEYLVNEFGSWCGEQVMRCALYAESVAQCRISNGGATAELMALFTEKLHTLQKQQAQHQLGFNATDDYAVAGSSGYALASKWLQDAQQAGTRGVKVFHYTAKDTAVVGLLHTLGAAAVGDDSDLWAPRFGYMVAMLVHDDGTVSFEAAEPEQEDGSGFSYPAGTVAMRVTCTAADGADYQSASCPLEDVWRFVNRTQPSVASPVCYLADADRCDVEDAPPEEPCLSYRQQCPLYACGDKAVLNRGKGYMCESFADRKTLGNYTLAAVLSAILGVVVGVVIGVLIAFILAHIQAREEERSLMSVIEAENE